MSLIKELKAEITRQARKKIRKELEPVKRVNATQRTLIANLRRELVALQKEVNQLKRAVPEEELPKPEEDGRQGFWITGKGVLSLRKRLGITQMELARLADVSHPTVVRWEKTKGKIPFRGEANARRMQELRSIDNRDAWRELGKSE